MTRTMCKLITAFALLASTVFLPQAALSGTCCNTCQTRLSSCEAACTSDSCRITCQDKYIACAEGCGRYGESCPF
jgi:hypothetical protein